MIIEKTAEVFNKKGYAGTSLSDLTAATGLTKGSIYGNFKNKEEVAIEAFRFNHRFMVNGFQQQLTGKETPIEKLLAFVDFFRDEYRAVFDRGGCALLNAATDVDDMEPRLFQEVKAAFQDWRSGLADIITEGIDRQEIQPVDARKMAQKMIAVMEGSILLSKTLEEPNILVDNMDGLKREILHLKTS
ncbi:TetR/AcrR family transcriptional regulator [Flavilitoribacter nigricans]|uniref:TetR/AcrR family transcriptional regulator n=1 Tax=Flavilitoribacter nigricans TaxID=70997 RepID=UPI00147277CD|nr:TetR/AcrR family transcriptional regulator [Flavilitoribacter nigricans]